ncbi:MAG TPA: WYL domain-containing protein [Acidimicrobiales bacterium]|nr:WYL domain-containing protein [Acidimicrobiales bacterium]
MRADRLIATLLLLQARGRMTAAELADELEISVRTARRDLEALAMAGVPVYPRPGRGGGWCLIGGARTDLTGLVGPEVRALFTALAASPEEGPDLGGALRKLMRATPEPLRAEARAAAETILADGTRWNAAPTAASDADRELLRRGVVEREELVLGYESPSRGRTVRTVRPLGLVAKAGVWYLVAGTEAGRRTFRLDRVVSVEPTGRGFERPADFDLTSAWREITDSFEERWWKATLVAEVEPWVLSILQVIPGLGVEVGEVVGSGRRRVELRGHSTESLARQLAGLVAGLEIVEPVGAREILAGIGRELTERYGSGANPDSRHPPAPLGSGGADGLSREGDPGVGSR